MNPLAKHYLTRSEASLGNLPLPAAVLQQRLRAREIWCEKGFPSRSVEAWKYTPLDFLQGITFTPYPPLAAKSVEVPCSKLTYTACFINGNYYPPASTLSNLPTGVIIAPLTQALTTHPELINQYYGQGFKELSPITALNESLWQEGLFIFIPQQLKIKPIIHVLHFNEAQNITCSNHLHHLVVVEADSEVTLLEEYVSDNQEITSPSPANLTTVVNEIILGKNSEVTHSRIQNSHRNHTLLTQTYVKQNSHSQYHHHSYDIGSKLNRNDLTIDLQEEYSECHLQGLYYVNQHIDNHLAVHHSSPRTKSVENYKGIIDHKGHGVFEGAVTVPVGSQGVNACQYNHNLLLADTAEIDTKPQLEIYADDVKCTHGATVGQLDEEALFYLQSRGIPTAIARQLLITGFFQSILEQQPQVIIRDQVSQLLDTKLAFQS